jgi:hypothetical protein
MQQHPQGEHIYRKEFPQQMYMSKYVLGFIIMLFFLVPVAAQTSPPPWSWNTYSGVSQWQVTITEDQSGCQGGVTTTQSSVSIQHNLTNAIMGDIGHGPAAGTFISGNILHIPGRVVDDPPGSSTLSAYDIFFTTDCSAFTGKYSWDYTGPDTAGACTGTTSFSGANSQGCPGSGEVTSVISPTPTEYASNEVTPGVTPTQVDYYASMLAGPHAELVNYLPLCDERDRLQHDIDAFTASSNLNYRLTGKYLDEPPAITQDRALLVLDKNKIATMGPEIENGYQMVLVKDPNNFQANWDMAQLKKSEGQLAVGIGYAKTALNNNVAGNEADAIKNDFAEGNNLNDYPGPGNSNFVATIGNNLPSASQNVYGTSLPQTSTEPSLLSNLWNFEIYVSPNTAAKDGNLVYKATGVSPP